MFRLLRKPAGVVAARAHAKMTSRTSVAVGPETIRVQRVVLRKGRITFRRVVIGATIIWLCSKAYGRVVMDPLADALEKEIQRMSPKEREKLMKKTDEDDALFVPFPFTTERFYPPPFKGEDPEWQMYIKVSKDKELLKKIRTDMTTLVKDAVERNPGLVQRAGDPLQVRRYWLDIDFPYGPPPAYRQKGIKWDEDGLSWDTRPIDSLTVSRLRRILWPSAMMESSYSFTKAFVWQQFSGLSLALGFKPPSGSVPGTSTPNLQPQAPRVNLQTGKERPPLPATTSRQIADGMAVRSTQPDEKAPNEKASHKPGPDATANGGSTRFPGQRDALRGPDAAREFIPDSVQTAVKGPWQAFQKKFTQMWQPLKDYPPSGCIQLSGFVEIEGSKSYIVIDVYAWWDPVTKKFDARSMWLTVRRLQRKQQAPIGR